jgi:hypothetical protein
MNANVKSTKIEETIEAALCPVAVATLANKGFERVVEAGKISLNLAAQQNADVLAAIKKALKGTPLATLPVLDLAGQAFEGLVAVQKHLLDLALEQSAATVASIESAKEIGLDANKAKAEFTSALQATLDRSIAAQNSVVEYAVKQTKAVNDAVKAQPGVAGSPAEQVADSVQRGFDSVVAAQKEILTLATKPLKTSAAKA